MAYHVYPTETPVGIFEVDPSNRLREYQWAQYQQYRAICSLASFKISGGALSVGAGLTADIAIGEWMIDGRWVSNDAVVNTGSMSDDHSHYIYFQLQYTGNIVTSVVEYDTSSTTPPVNSVMVGIVNISGGVVSVTSTLDNVTAGSSKALTGSIYSSSYTGDGRSPRTILLGFQPKHVEVYGEEISGTNTDFISFSGGVMIRNGEDPATTVTYSTSAVYVPVPVVTGFQVSRSSGTGLNVSGNTYYYRAYV
jgi:hypothetical protein